MAKFVDKIELGAGSAGEFSKCLYEILLAGKRVVRHKFCIFVANTRPLSKTGALEIQYL